MDWELTLVLLLILAYAAGLAVAIVATIDVLQFDDEAWLASGHNRGAWVLQAFGVVAPFVSLVVGGIYLWKVRPDLTRERSILETLDEQPQVAEWESAVASSTSEPLPPRVRLRNSPVSGVVFLGAALAIFYVVIGADSWFWIPYLVIVTGSGLWFGVTLTSDRAVALGFRRRPVPWGEVATVRVERRFGYRAVVLVMHDGYRVRLRAPVSSLGIGVRRFERDADLIGRYWVAHRGPLASVD